MLFHTSHFKSAFLFLSLLSLSLSLSHIYIYIYIYIYPVVGLVEVVVDLAADVSSLVRILNAYKEEQVKSEGSNGKSKGLITRDLLGGCSNLGSQELDLDLQVPNGWEKRLDMKSGKVYLQRCSSPISTSSSSSSSDQKQNRTVPELQDLNFPPSSTTSSNFMEESYLDLKLVPSYDYHQSVCTLDKVKSALERAEKESGTKRIDCSSSSSSSIKEEEEEKKASGLLFAAGCPSCLLYVLISKKNPKCPRCDSIVPSPIFKKPRIDLNASI